MNSIWIIIFVGALITYTLRAFPYCLPFSDRLNAGEPIERFFRGCSFAILGQMIGEALFSPVQRGGLNNAGTLLALVASLLAFGLMVRTGKQLRSFLISFALLVLFGQWVGL